MHLNGENYKEKLFNGKNLAANDHIDRIFKVFGKLNDTKRLSTPIMHVYDHYFQN